MSSSFVTGSLVGGGTICLILVVIGSLVGGGTICLVLL